MLSSRVFSETDNAELSIQGAFKDKSQPCAEMAD